MSMDVDRVDGLAVMEVEVQVTATLVLPRENQALLAQKAGDPEVIEENTHRLAARSVAWLTPDSLL